MEANIKLMVVMTKLNNVFLSKLGKNLEDLHLPASMYPILAHLNEVGETRINTLSDVALITGGTVTYIVNKLEKLGYVTKYSDENDKRSNWVQITEAGKVVFHNVHFEHMKYLNELLSDLSEKEKYLFIEQIKYFGKTMKKKEVL